LLRCDKQQLSAALVESAVPWLDDASNLSPKYLRNRVRAQV
jgi:tRNA(Ile)-lysidine synthase TilS/MesJ